MNFNNPTWGGKEPRAWQAEAFPIATAHLSSADPSAAVIRAIMGAGKSVLIAELCGAAVLSPDACIVVSTSSEMLVRQLSADIGARCHGKRHVGVWYGKKKRLGSVIVTCIPSVLALAEKLHHSGRKVALWIADEAHRTECSTILDAHDTLAPARTLGFTATPFRADERQTLRLFKTQIYDYGADRALRDGVVVPWRIMAWTEPVSDLDTACIQMIRETGGPGLCNAVSMKDAEGFATLLTTQGIPAAAIHSGMEDRKKYDVLRRLEHGDLRCLVHVNMLTEGANYPFLRWLCLRREVDSRVRFQQEIGRVLRTAPGKAEAVFLDPNDLFGKFPLTFAQALGDPLPKDPAEAFTELPPERKADVIVEAKDATAISLIELEIRRLIVACDASGMVGARTILSRVKRQAPSSKIQHQSIAEQGFKASPFVPESYRPLIELMLERCALLSKGFASDLHAALWAIVLHRRWPPLDDEGRIHSGVEVKSAAIVPVEFSPVVRLENLKNQSFFPFEAAQ